MRRKIRITSIIYMMVFALSLLGPCFATKAYAKDLDVIHEYDITADVQEDGRVRIRYRIDWEVLDSTSEGPLTWVKIGIPNSHVSGIKGLSDNIKSIKYYNDKGYFVRIDFNREYNAGECLVIEFEITQSNLYEPNKYTDGETVISFTPGWFPEITVEKMVLKWNNNNVLNASPEGTDDGDGYITWQKALAQDEKYTIEVSYSSDAITSVDVAKSTDAPNPIKDADAYNAYMAELQQKTLNKAIEESRTPARFNTNPSTKSIVICGIIIGVVGGVIIFIGVCIARYRMRGGDPDMVTRKRMIWTLIEYHTQCPNCGSPRMPNRNNCEYCGASMIKSEQKMEKSEIKKLKKQLKKDGLWDNLNTTGICQLGRVANVYVRIRSDFVYLPRVSVLGRVAKVLDIADTFGGSGGGCACACAGGGRAGCSTKDFYNTGLKLRQLELKKNNKSNERRIYAP